MSFKSFLLEFAHLDASALTNTPEFLKFQECDPLFAKKLVSAWKGDSSDFSKDKEKFDGLFDKMISPEGIKKFSPKCVELKAEAAKLLKMHRSIFPNKNLNNKFKKFSGDQWENQDYGTYKRGRA